MANSGFGCVRCGRADIYAKCLCQACYQRDRRHGRGRFRNGKRCGLDGCDRPFYALDLCRVHYDGQRRAPASDATRRR